MSSADFSAKSTCRVRTSVRDPIFRCPLLRCLPLGPPDLLRILTFDPDSNGKSTDLVGLEVEKLEMKKLGP